MRSAINISTLAGVRLDVNPAETIELNMGGVSLLSLQQRTVSYTNTFKLPRTPTNEAVFAFASQPTRNNRPAVDVIIRKGTFERRSTLRVIDFDDGYNVSISYDYDKIIEKLQEINFYSFFPLWDEDPANLEGVIATIPTGATDVEFREAVCNRDNVSRSGLYFFPIQRQRTNVLAVPAITIYQLFEHIEKIHNIKITGAITTNSVFLKTFIFNPNVKITNTLVDDGTINAFYSHMIQKVGVKAIFVSIATVMKVICQMFALGIEFKDSEISLITTDTSAATIDFEGFTFTKQYTSGYSYENFIVYKHENEETKYLGSDSFLGDGIGEKDVMVIENTIPKFYDTVTLQYPYSGYDMESTSGKLSIMASAGLTLNHFDGTEDVSSFVAQPLSMSGVYSDIIGNIFYDFANDRKGVILKSQRHFSPTQAQDVMDTRIITSVQLGGTYWVDEMSYNLNTGNAVMTLIKIR